MARNTAISCAWLIWAGYSVELCGGAHLKNTAQVGSFKIVSENGVAAGVRRIEALTGEGALLHYQAQEDEVRTLAQMVKTSPDKLVARVEQLLAEQKELSKELEKLKAKMAGGAADEMLSKKVDINGVAVLAAEVKDMDANAMRTLGDQLKNKLGSGVIVLAGAAGGKVSLMAMQPMCCEEGRTCRQYHQGGSSSLRRWRRRSSQYGAGRRQGRIQDCRCTGKSKGNRCRADEVS